ncbi:glycoside hydrolase family protein [Melaminivora sp.]|uniref:lysozyme n=1 Tax=Melaminivora sp. TaxID=1933032 RepID=UPI0028AB06B1|nr:lysozyme [Melaminivora sp.]
MRNPQPPQPKPIPINTKGGAVVLAAGAGILALLTAWEPDKRDPGLVYADKLAQGLPTVCRGLTRHTTKLPVVVGERWSPEKCLQEETAVLLRVQTQLARCFTRADVPQSVFDAASSHAWNQGASATCGSGAMAAWNRGEWERGCNRLARGDDGSIVWSYVSHIDPATKKKVFTFVQGLANRRADEVQHCLRDVREGRATVVAQVEPQEPAPLTPEPVEPVPTLAPEPQPERLPWWRRIFARS